VVFTICEEIGLLGAKHLAYEHVSARVGYVLDTRNPEAIVTRAPSADRFTFRIHGKAAHAGAAPEKGINAIALAAKAISRLDLGRIDHETTCNIGVIEGGVAMPAVAVRGAMTKLSGVNQLALDTKSVDLSISKGFAMLTPYAGVGQVWVNSTPDAATTFKAESFKQSKVFAGANLNFGLTNLAVEFDKTGSAQSTSLKLGFRF
jgi:acetylornithine deacetylase/succinyl-diaminopimelate desuccinylase-like protein